MSVIETSTEIGIKYNYCKFSIIINKIIQVILSLLYKKNVNLSQNMTDFKIESNFDQKIRIKS